MYTDNTNNNNNNNNNTRKEKMYKQYFLAFVLSYTMAEKEIWLKILLEATDSNNSTNNSTGCSNAAALNNFYLQKEGQGGTVGVEVQAFLVILKAMASKEAVEDTGACHKANLWIKFLYKYYCKNNNNKNNSSKINSYNNNINSLL